VALKGVEYLKKIGIADVCNIGTEPELLSSMKSNMSKNSLLAFIKLIQSKATGIPGVSKSPI